MPSVNRSALMPFSAEKMYNIVNAVDEYPQFLQWCANSQIESQNDSHMQATILMKKGKLNHSFTTKNTLTAGEKIEVNLVDGPFKSLSGYWSFIALDDNASKIELNLKFEFSNQIVNLLIGPVFTQISNSLVDSFCLRARQIYQK